MEEIRKKWQQAAKVAGSQNVLTLANGEQVAGRYYLAEVGSCTASHNALAAFTPSAGFPTDANGQTVNDRDYQRDADAQAITRQIAANYDSRAMQSPVIVSRDGVVLSGNGRTMAGELAAYGGTDGAYIDYLRRFCALYGFNAGQVGNFAHPRILFQLDADLPYNAATFAMFNAQEMKTQSKTEQAIKFGKLVTDAVFARIIATINGFETLSDFYQSTEAAARCVSELRTAGVISAMQYAEIYDGDAISSAGREILENVLIGKAFAGDPDAARKITSYKNIRRTVVIALGEISNNITLGDGYTLNAELSEAIALAYQARKEGDYKDGERVSDFARQCNLFGGGTVADFDNAVIMLLADVLNDKKDALLRRILAVYNHQAKDAAAGQTDMFCTGGVKSKTEILEEVKALFWTGTAKAQREAVGASVAHRTAENLFLTDEQLTKVVAGAFVEYTTPSGAAIVCKVERTENLTAYLIAKGGVSFTADISRLTPTASHALTFPEWLKAGEVITDGKTLSQRIAAVTDTSVIFEWINGGCFMAHLSTILQQWQPSPDGICEVKEAA